MKPYFAVQWHITDFCDQRCKHCYIYSEGHDRIISTSHAELERTLAEIRSFCAKIGREPYIYLTGGDPILHPDFWHLLSLFQSQEIRFCVMGNPFHLTDDVCGRMRDAGCVKYQLSLDGLERTHDRFRKKGSFRATMEAARRIRKSGMWLALMSTVSRANMDEIPRVIDLAHKSERTFTPSDGTAPRARGNRSTRASTSRRASTAPSLKDAGSGTRRTEARRRPSSSKTTCGRSFCTRRG